ncbi:hypothetical protein V6N11_027331 [Hibiscus sabdariffa]|uniref:Uncharacterized protein n=1 Tax=Hibiscus sabdariffa TaxID=183260 RepID=A0ABR2PHB4_9ROSI
MACFVFEAYVDFAYGHIWRLIVCCGVDRTRKELAVRLVVPNGNDFKQSNYDTITVNTAAFGEYYNSRPSDIDQVIEKPYGGDS